MTSISGLNDYDYQNLSTLSMGMKQLNQLVTTNKVPIPPEIMDHFKRMRTAPVSLLYFYLTTDHLPHRHEMQLYDGTLPGNRSCLADH